jgi:CcmD family protein
MPQSVPDTNAFDHATPSDPLQADPDVAVTPAGDSLLGTPAGSPTTLVPSAPPYGLEKYALQQDKLYVVAAVLLVIWIGIAFYLARTDRRIAALERLAAERDAFQSEPPSADRRIPPAAPPTS